MVDTTNLYVLYGFKTPFSLDLDEADAMWLEANADARAYARTRRALPVGFWLNEGCIAELVDCRMVSKHDPRVRATRYGAALYLRTLSQAETQSPYAADAFSTHAVVSQWKPRSLGPSSHRRTANNVRGPSRFSALKESA
jgi:hypothetical protein